LIELKFYVPSDTK